MSSDEIWRLTLRATLVLLALIGIVKLSHEKPRAIRCHVCYCQSSLTDRSC